MRFKSKMTPEQVSCLYQVVAALSKVQPQQQQQQYQKQNVTQSSQSQQAVLYLDPDHVRISCKNHHSGSTSNNNSNSNSHLGGVHCFAELTTTHDLFEDYRIESAANNIICLSLDLWSFKVALQSMTNSSSSTNNRNNMMNPLQQTQTQPTQHEPCLITLKLAKRNRMPCLCLDTTASGGMVELHQAIPIRILRSRDMQSHLPPPMASPTVQLELVSNGGNGGTVVSSLLKGTMDKLRQRNNAVYLEASMKGDLTVRMESDHGAASMACFYDGLIPRWPQQQHDDDNVDGDEQEPNNDDQNGADDSSTPQDPASAAGQSQSSDNGQNRSNNSSSSSSNKRRHHQCVLKVNASHLAHCLHWQPTSTTSSSNNANGSFNSSYYASSSSSLPIESCLLGMVPNELLVLHIVLQGGIGFFTYYMPVYVLDEEERAELQLLAG